jgi:hypothetical protein
VEHLSGQGNGAKLCSYIAGVRKKKIQIEFPYSLEFVVGQTGVGLEGVEVSLKRMVCS